MGLDLPDGGHLSHGYATPTKKISATSVFFETMPYKVDPKTGLIDYDELAKTSKLFRPKIIVAGISCYSRNLDYARFRSICDEIDAILLADMAHVSGLVAANVVANPFDYADVVTSTTHKSLRGPRAALIFFRRGLKKKQPAKKAGKEETPQSYDYEKRINEAIFPGLQGGPHNNSIGAIGVALKEASTKEFQVYAQQVIDNAKQLVKSLQEKGYTFVSGAWQLSGDHDTICFFAGGTDTHLALLDLRPLGLDGAKVEKVLEEVSIAVNKNTCPGDKSALKPSGIRLGTPALTTRGFQEKDITQVANYLDQAIQIAVQINKSSDAKKSMTLKEFKENMKQKEHTQRLEDLKHSIESFAEKYPMPGYEDI